jgi:hypothetical protein
MAEPTAEPADALARFAALLTPEGQELLGRLREAGDSVSDLRLGTDLRAAYPVDLVVDALAQHELRLRARAKFSRAMGMYFTRAGLEQASGEVIAGHRMARYAGAGLVADLCCGIGGDLTALAAARPHGTSAASPRGCAPWTWGRWTSGGAGWPVTWPNCTASYGFPGHAGSRW